MCLLREGGAESELLRLTVRHRSAERRCRGREHRAVTLRFSWFSVELVEEITPPPCVHKQILRKNEAAKAARNLLD